MAFISHYSKLLIKDDCFLCKEIAHSEKKEQENERDLELALKREIDFDD